MGRPWAAQRSRSRRYGVEWRETGGYNNRCQLKELLGTDPSLWYLSNTHMNSGDALLIDGSVLTPGSKRRSLHQDVEAGLFEVVVSRQSVVQAVVLHDDERDAIGQ